MFYFIIPPPSFVMFILVTKKMCINYFYLWPLMDIQPDLLKSSRTLQCLGRDWGLMIIYDLSLGLGVWNRATVSVWGGYDVRPKYLWLRGSVLNICKFNISIDVWYSSGLYMIYLTSHPPPTHSAVHTFPARLHHLRQRRPSSRMLSSANRTHEPILSCSAWGIWRLCAQRS